MVPDPRRELEILLASHFALIAVNSREESRVLHLLRDAGKKASRGRSWALFQWSVTEGLRRLDTDMGGAQRTNAEPQQLLRHLKSTSFPGIYVEVKRAKRVVVRAQDIDGSPFTLDLMDLEARCVAHETEHAVHVHGAPQ